jgi:hypothetical protein
MNEFVFLYRRPAKDRTVQQMQESMQRWQAWFKKMEQSGHLANYGQPLDTKGGRVVKDKQGGYTDGPYAETKDIVVGYSVVRAKDYDEAVALTDGHPIFDQGGMIEIRPVFKMEE